MLRMIYEHALSVSHCLAITRGHVQCGYLTVPQTHKSKWSLVSPWPSERLSQPTLSLFESVTKHIAKHTLVFPFSRQWADELFYRAAAAANVELQLGQGLHSLRHSWAYHLLDAGASLATVQRALRHRWIGDTALYLENRDVSDPDDWRFRLLADHLPDKLVPAIARAIRTTIESDPDMSMDTVVESVAKSFHVDCDAVRRLIHEIQQPDYFQRRRNNDAA